MKPIGSEGGVKVGREGNVGKIDAQNSGFTETSGVINLTVNGGRRQQQRRGGSFRVT